MATLDSLVTALTALPAALQLNAVAAVFCRIGAFLVFFPGYSSSWVPVRIRVCLGVSVALAMQPLLLPSVPQVTPEIIVSEVSIGLLFAALARIFVMAAEIAGALMAQAIGLVNVFDPHADSEGASILSSFLGLAVTTAFFASDGTYHVLKALQHTYELFPCGKRPGIGDVNAQALKALIECFRAGIQAATPFLILSWVLNLGLGFVNRIMPQMPVFFIGQSAWVLLGLTAAVPVCGAFVAQRSTAWLLQI